MTEAATDTEHILIIEDEANIASFARMYLEAEGFRVSVADRGDTGLAIARDEEPSLVVVDLMLPGIDGFEITRQLRSVGRTPIIMLTARDDPIDKVVGLEMGADDYITKPFNPRELVARIRAVLRRSETGHGNGDAPDDTVIVLGELRIALGGREVMVGDTSVALTPKEFDLLVLLVENRGIVLTREQLLERVWGYTFLGDSRTIDVHIRQLRRKLGDACQIETVWGTGYKVVAPR
jgi:two-component system, OmpR family, alkaline phosphatase synthesis response regulator PhoP